MQCGNKVKLELGFEQWHYINPDSLDWIVAHLVEGLYDAAKQIQTYVESIAC